MRLFPRSVFTEMLVIFMCYGLALQFWAETYEQQVGLHVALVVYMLLPESIRVLPPSYMPAWYFKYCASLCPRKEKSWAEATASIGGPTQEKYVVIGGAGFLGSRITHALFLRGEKRITVADVDEEAMKPMKKLYGNVVEFVKVDITKREQVDKVLKGADCVYSPAAVIRFWEQFKKHWPRSFRVNVDGYKNVVESCVALGVKRLVVTSSSAAIERFPGFETKGISDASPLCNEKDYQSNYALSKSLQEQLVVNANGRNGLATGCIRACTSVFGPGDKLALGKGVAGGMFPYMCGPNIIDFVYVDCIALAHLLLEKRLRDGSKSEAGGQAFCISNQEPMAEATFAYLVEDAAKAEGMRVSASMVPTRLMYVLSIFITAFDYFFSGNTASVLGSDLSSVTFATLMTSTKALVVTDFERSTRILGYEPHISVASALQRTMREFNGGQVFM